MLVLLYSFVLFCTFITAPRIKQVGRNYARSHKSAVQVTGIRVRLDGNNPGLVNACCIVLYLAEKPGDEPRRGYVASSATTAASRESLSRRDDLSFP